jgi:hypothetical protein
VGCFPGNLDDNLAMEHNSQFVSTKVLFSSDVELGIHEVFLEI